METNNVLSDFVTMRENFQRGIEEYFSTKSATNIIKIHKEIHASEGDKRMALEQSIRDKFLSIWTNNPGDVDNFRRVISMCVLLAQKESLAPVMPVTLLSDMFDTVTLSVAEQLFEYVQELLITWKSDLFFAPCKNVILRMCNDLLRRLPRAKNTRFCGQILLFLALFFPFSERSGLNIISEFNSENVTKYNDNPNINLEGDVITSIIPEQLTSKMNNDFYTKFWSLQETFRNPTLCYNEAKWKDFVENSESVLKLFSNCKMEKSASSKSNSKAHLRNQSYSMKYLTCEKLLVLQLNDINFRRVLFLQYLILFQYLRSFVKSRPETYDLNVEQVEWIKKSTSTLQRLCRESSPDGNKFFKSIQKILERDSYWNRWKNESCPALKRKKATISKDPPKVAKFNLKHSLADIYQESKTTNKMVTNIGNKHREWTVKSDYLKQCKTFPNHPNLKSRIEDIVLEADPAAQIEEKYKKVSNMKFIWQTLKLYHQKGPPRCFNSPAQAVPNKIPEYVEYMSKQISRDITFKAIQARIKKQAGELKARQEPKTSKDDKDKEGSKSDSEGRLKTDHSPIKEEEEEEEEDDDDDKMEVEAVDLEEEATSEEEEAGSSGKESDEEPENEEMETEETSPTHTNGEVETKSECKKDKVAKEDLEKIAKEITGDWKKVGEKLGYKSDEIEYFNAQEEEEYDRALNMLDVWFSNESDATIDNLFKALDSLGLAEASKIVENLPKS